MGEGVVVGPVASRFFGTFFRINNGKGLDFFRVVYNAKENEEKNEKDNDNCFLKMTPSYHNLRGSVLTSIPLWLGEGGTTPYPNFSFLT